jgi:enoyl-CoA hydratase/carnithine racemase
MASTYTTEDGVALISLDDGKVNALGSAVIAELQEHLDHARRDAASAR